MLTKELILGILHGQKFTAKVYGSPADIISAEDFDTVAEEILLIAQPNSEPSPQLQQTPCSKLLPSIQEMIDVIEAEKVRYPRMWTADVLRLLNKVKELAAIA